MVLARRKNEQLSRRDLRNAVADAECGGAPDDEVQLRLGVKVARAAAANRLRIFPDVRNLVTTRQKALIERSPLRIEHSLIVSYSSEGTKRALGAMRTRCAEGFPKKCKLNGQLVR